MDNEQHERVQEFKSHRVPYCQLLEQRRIDGKTVSVDLWHANRSCFVDFTLHGNQQHLFPPLHQRIGRQVIFNPLGSFYPCFACTEL